MKLWHGIILGLIYFLIGYFAAAFLGIPFDIRSTAFTGLLTLITAIPIILSLPPIQRKNLFRIKKPLLIWSFGILLGKLMFSQLSGVISVMSGYSNSGTEMTNASLLIQIVTFVFLGPVDEELIFRGGLIHGLCEKFSWKTSVALSAFLFTVAHAWPTWPQTFLTAILLGYMYWYTGSLSYGIIIHILFNAKAFIPISCAPLLEWNLFIGTILTLLIVTAGLAIALWAIRGFTRCSDQLESSK